MPDKGDKKKKSSNKGKTPKEVNPVILDGGSKMHKPVKGMPQK